MVFFFAQKMKLCDFKRKKTRNRIMIVLEKLHDRIGLQNHLLWEIVVQIMYRSSTIVSHGNKRRLAFSPASFALSTIQCE